MFNSDANFSPEMVEDLVIEVKDGRHPVIDQLLGEGEQYVPNDTSMDVSQQSHFLQYNCVYLLYRVCMFIICSRVDCGP